MASTSPTLTPTAVRDPDAQLDRRLALISVRLRELTRDGDPLPGSFEDRSIRELRAHRALLLAEHAERENGHAPNPFARLPQPSDDGGF